VATSAQRPARPLLLARVPDGGSRDPDVVLGRFLAWIADAGLAPYPAQEEALLELFAGRHVVLQTPTGSGKSLVALALHFKAMCEGARSFYTAPIKALVSEKFFSLCDDFGAINVGMLTGDASLNPGAPIVCCTQEVLANMALRRGDALDAPYAVMDEFHYYGDRDRGMAWQVPLLALPRTQFLLLSATLGDTGAIERALARRSGREVAHVKGGERPVPLDFAYREEPLHEAVEGLVASGRAPVYLVSFTQRECAENAQALTSAHVATRETREEIAAAIAGFRFDSPYGKDVQRFVRHGVGVHHAGLLPKYRLLVEQLAQQGLLRVICGTDTLGVGVNVPIRTVLFSKLCKYDGEKVAILSVRDFQQIAGRAGRKGFDEQGFVVALAPEHVVANKRAAEKSAGGGKKPAAKKKPPAKGFVPWGRDTFDRLVTRPPEPLASRFALSHGVVVNVLQRENGEDDAPGSGYRALLELVSVCHETDTTKRRLRREAAVLFRSLRRAEILRLVRDPRTGRTGTRVAEDLQRDFGLHQTLSLYLVEAVAALDPAQEGYALAVLSLVEAILENPWPVLWAQVDRAKQAALAEMKAAGVPYEDRIRELDEITWPKPNADAIYATFNLFARHHPWLAEENIRPKSVAREMFEGCMGFHDYVRAYGLARVEGVLLRYLGQAYSTLAQSVPESARTDELEDVLAFLRVTTLRADASLVEEWERLAEPASAGRAPADGAAAPPRRALDLAASPKALGARVRAELHRVVRALALRDFAEAAAGVAQDPDDPWDAARFERELAPFFADHERVVFGPEARRAHRTRIVPAPSRGPRHFDVTQVLVDPEGDDDWCLEGEIALPAEGAPEGPLVRPRRVGT
jgi:superfamily II RNA helicase